MQEGEERFNKTYGDPFWPLLWPTGDTTGVSEYCSQSRDHYPCYLGPCQTKERNELTKPKLCSNLYSLLAEMPPRTCTNQAILEWCSGKENCIIFRIDQSGIPNSKN